MIGLGIYAIHCPQFDAAIAGEQSGKIQRSRNRERFFALREGVFMAVNMILLSDFTAPCFRTAFQAYFAELDISVKDWDGLFREMSEEGNNLAFLLLEEGRTLGFLQFQMTSFSNWFFEEPIGFIREFWVDPTYRRQGHGKFLLHSAETYFLEHGVYCSVLTADDAASFYLANGYKKAWGIKPKNKMDVFIRVLHEQA